MQGGSQSALRSRITDGIRSVIGEAAVVEFGAASSNIRNWYSTGLAALDVAISGEVGKGIPAGRVVELFGEESVGKSSLGGSIMRQVQLANGVAVLIDTESTFTNARAVMLGIDPDALVYVEEQYLEPILDAIPQVVKRAKDAPCVIFWDTVAGTPSKKEQALKSGESAAFGAHARALSIWLRGISKTLSASNTALVLCNQRKEGAIGVPYATERQRDATMGGKAIKFHSEIRFRLMFNTKIIAPGGKGQQRGRDIGFETTARVVKNKNGIQGGYARLVFSYETGTYDDALSCLRTLQRWRVLPEKDGGGTTIIHPTTLEKKNYSKDAFVRAYNGGVNGFRKSMHKMMELAFQNLFSAATPMRPDDDLEEDSTE